jgi:hypothetical protein
MNIQTSLNFLTNYGTEPAVTNLYGAPSTTAGVLRTNIKDTVTSVIVLSDRTQFNNNNGCRLG